MRDKTGVPGNPPIGQRNYHDLERRSPFLYQIINDSMLSEGAKNKLYWMRGGIDGGEIGITEAMAGFVDEPTTFDGGTV